MIGRYSFLFVYHHASCLLTTNVLLVTHLGNLFFQVESELTELPSEERIEFLNSLGVDESGLGNLIRATYDLLGLRTYFTSGEKVK